MTTSYLNEFEANNFEAHAVGVHGLGEPDGDLQFWYWRPSLKSIHDDAIARMCAPWAVFAHCAAKALAIVPPHVTLPPIIGGPGSLNWFAIIVDRSGGGKGAAAAVARQLTGHRCGTIPVRNLGSGEGIIDAYYRPGNKKEGTESSWRESVHFNADEIDNMTTQGGRAGSTLMPWLRSAFNAETLGATTIRSGGEHLAAHTYRLVLTVSAQPGRCAGLLDDHAGGTPQRFMWFPGNDPRIRAVDRSDIDPPPLDLPGATAWQYPQTLTVPNLVADQIATARELQGQGLCDALDGHAMFAREKVAYALAVLDGRTTMNDTDWMLSEFVADVSSMTREWVSVEVAAALAGEAARRGDLQAVTGIARHEGTTYRIQRRVNRFTQRLTKHLAQKQPMTENELRRLLAADERTWFAQTLQAAVAADLVAVDVNGRYWCGRAVPAALRRPSGAV